MNLKTITCSDMREYNEIDDIIDLGKRYPMAEFAIQAHPSKFSWNMPRYAWFNTLMHAVSVDDVQLAMHVNKEYRNGLCNGFIPEHIFNMWNMRRNNGRPVIGRVQINIGTDTDYDFNTKRIADMIASFPDIEFIFQYSTAQKERISELDTTGIKFSLLYDASGGRGISPDGWNAPAFEGHKMGYSGGMSPDNVYENLNKISHVLPAKYDTWIDAEGKLKDPDTGHFDIARAEKYIQNGLKWQIHKGHIR